MMGDPAFASARQSYPGGQVLAMRQQREPQQDLLAIRRVRGDETRRANRIAANIAKRAGGGPSTESDSALASTPPTTAALRLVSAEASDCYLVNADSSEATSRANVDGFGQTASESEFAPTSSSRLSPHQADPNESYDSLE